MSGVEFNTDVKLNEKQHKRLMFIISQFYPEFKGMEVTKENHKKFQEAKEKIMNEALHKYYKEVVGNINQGNEHDGLPLIKEIYD